MKQKIIEFIGIMIILFGTIIGVFIGEENFWNWYSLMFWEIGIILSGILVIGFAGDGTYPVSKN